MVHALSCVTYWGLVYIFLSFKAMFNAPAEVSLPVIFICNHMNSLMLKYAMELHDS